MPSRCAAKAIGTTGTPTMPNMYSTPCCLRLRAISVAPSTSAIGVSSCGLGVTPHSRGDAQYEPQLRRPQHEQVQPVDDWCRLRLLRGRGLQPCDGRPRTRRPASGAASCRPGAAPARAKARSPGAEICGTDSTRSTSKPAVANAATVASTEGNVSTTRAASGNHVEQRDAVEAAREAHSRISTGAPGRSTRSQIRVAQAADPGCGGSPSRATPPRTTHPPAGCASPPRRRNRCADRSAPARPLGASPRTAQRRRLARRTTRRMPTRTRRSPSRHRPRAAPAACGDTPLSTSRHEDIAASGSARLCS